MFCYQQNFFTPTKEVDRDVFWALVGAPYTKELIDGIREEKQHAAAFLEAGDENAAKIHQKAADQLKKKLPAFIFQATFDTTKSKKGYEGEWRKQAATRLTGLVVMDIDHVENPQQKFDEWVLTNGNIFLDEGILLVYVTPSGHGLKVVFKARTEWGNLIDNQHRMAALLGVEVDEACKDASRMSFICRKEDILFINEQELFTYENKEFSEKFNDVYRGGHSQPTLFDAVRADDANGVAADGAAYQTGTGDAVELQQDSPAYRGVAYDKIIETWLGGKTPAEGDRHNTLLKLATDLRYITDNSAKRMREVLMQQQWVRDLADDGDSIDTVIKSAQEYKMYQTVPKRMREVLMKAGVKTDETADSQDKPVGSDLPLGEWGERVAALFDEFPCLREACHGLPVASYPAALFVSAAFLGTDMTRTWYYFYHRPEEQRRLNYCIMVIGDPASGKSFATRLYKLLAAPLIAADRVGNDAMNRYKQELKKRSSSSKEQKKDGLTEPDVTVRCLGSRTANGVFIKNMNKAVETVDGQPLHLHLLTFDSELDSATIAQRGGQWIDKSVMELKAFHNEQDDQQYANVDSMNGPFDVYWNYVYTGTPLSLGRKVTERNFGSGLSTRLAVIPMPPSDYKMMALSKVSKTDHAADELLKTWAFRLDGVKGELPLWPLVENVWQWANDRLQVAEFNQDKADELLIKRVPYYGICVAAPFILMRHWEEWQEKKTFEIDDTDRELSNLVMNIQYAAQWHYFGEMAKAYFDNQRTKELNSRRRPSRYDYCYEQLPDEFTSEDVMRVYGNTKVAAALICSRLKKQGFVDSPKRAIFRKLKTSLI